MSTDKIVIQSRIWPSAPTLVAFLLILKLGKAIDCSWWWVFCPLWIPVVAFFVIMGLIVVVPCTIAIVLGIFNRIIK